MVIHREDRVELPGRYSSNPFQKAMISGTSHHYGAGSERARGSGSVCASSDAGGPANAVRSHLVPWPYRFELEEDDQVDSALGSIGGFRFDRLLGKKLNEWPPYHDGSRQLGSTLRGHLPG